MWILHEHKGLFSLVFLFIAVTGSSIEDGRIHDDYEQCSFKLSTAASRRFAFALYKTATKTIGEARNVLISPLAIATSLAMITAGATEKTWQQIIKTLEQKNRNEPELTADCILYAYNARRYNVQFLVKNPELENDNNQIAILRTSSRIYGDMSRKFDSKFVEATGQYGAEMDVVNFNAPRQATERINSWVADQTNNNVKQMLRYGVISRSTTVAITNAIYFKASWQTPFFSNVSAGVFHTVTGRQVPVEYMNLLSPARYTFSERLRSDMVEIPYASPDGSNVDARLILILPQNNVSFRSVEMQLKDEPINMLMERDPFEHVNIYIPKFSVITEHKLKYILRRMGIKAIFQANKAKLYGMAEPSESQKELYISSTVHKSYFDVNESGTLAADIKRPLNSNFSPTTGSPRMRKIYFNRPFLYILCDKYTDSILFIGRFSDPTKNKKPR